MCLAIVSFYLQEMVIYDNLFHIKDLFRWSAKYDISHPVGLKSVYLPYAELEMHKGLVAITAMFPYIALSTLLRIVTSLDLFLIHESQSMSSILKIKFLILLFIYILIFNYKLKSYNLFLMKMYIHY